MAINEQTLRRLRDIVGVAHVRTDDGVRAAYARDATPLFHHPPDVVVHPGDTGQVARVLALATAERIPVVPRGAGSNLCAGTVPVRGGIVLALTRLNRILEISPEEQLARVECGVTVATLAEAVAAHRLLYPPDPGSRTVATVGGTVATSAGGLRGLKYGVTRNYVLGVTAVLPTGEVIRTGGRLWKDVAGYDLTRLLTGSEGTLAVLTEITVALLPAPAVARTGIAYFADLAAAGQAVTAVLRGGVVPATLEFLDRPCITAVNDYAGLGLRTDAGALLLFGQDGDEELVDAHLARIAEHCAANGAFDIQTAGDVAESEALLAARRCSLPALARLGDLVILEDASVPRPHIPRMVRRIDEIAERYDVTIATFGHAGDGNLHPTCVLHAVDGVVPAERIAAAEAAFAEIFATALELDGTITGEHGVGAAKLPYLPARLGPEQLALTRRIKHAFDPAGILNPGKVGS